MQLNLQEDRFMIYCLARPACHHHWRVTGLRELTLQQGGSCILCILFLFMQKRKATNGICITEARRTWGPLVIQNLLCVLQYF